MNPKNNVTIPSDVPTKSHKEFIKNYQAIIGPSGNLLLFAADQKIEHLNADFYGPGIALEAQTPEHLFNIATNSNINAMATHLGLIARYGKKYPDVNYIIKLNGKTNLPKGDDPISSLLWTVEDAIDFKKSSKLNIRGVGFTLYLGSEYEAEMLSDAAQSIFEAHQHGLVTILWCYIRSKEISNEQDPALIAGAAGVAATLGADFVKIKPPKPTETINYSDALKIACKAAGNTKVICSGGKKVNEQELLHRISEQIQAGTSGCAIGRNIFQRPLSEAAELVKSLSTIIRGN